MSKATVLIVEDDGILAMNLHNMLEFMDYKVAGPLASGEEAIAFVPKHPVDLVLMDIELAGTMNGITAAETINRTTDIPVVFLTGFSHDPLLAQAKVAAPYGYLIKPVSERELAATLEMTLHRHLLNCQLKESQAALERSEAKYRHLFENSPLGIFRTTMGGKVLAVNAEMVRIFGCDTSEEVIREFPDLSKRFYVDPERRREFVALLRKYGSVQHFESEIQRKGGERLWVSLNAKLTPGDGANGQAGEQVIDGFAIDITERKQVEAVQAFLAQTGTGSAAEPFFNSLVQFLARSLAMDFVCIDYLEGDGLTVRTVAVWCDGQFADNVTYALKDTPCGEVVERTVCCYPASVCQFFPNDLMLQELKAESYAGTMLFSHAGQPIGLIAVVGRKPLANCILAENTLKMVAGRAAGEMERREAEAALRESEQKHRTLVAGLPDMVMRFDPEGRLLFASENVKEVFGVQAGQCIGWTHRELGFSEELSRFWEQALQGVCASGEPFENELSFLGNQGQVIHNIRLVPEWDAQGQIQSVLALSRDITAHRLADQNYQTLFREMLDGFALHEIICDQEGKPDDYRFLAVNPAFERMTGLRATDIIGRTVLEVLPLTEPHWIVSFGYVALTGRPLHFEHYSSALGKCFEVSAFQPNPNTFACIFIDITERKRAEEKIRRNESRLRMLVNILQHPSETIQDFLDYALEQALQMTGSKIGYIYHYHEERKELVLNSWSKDVLPACAVANPQTCTTLDATGLWGEAVRQRRPLIINDFQVAHPLKKGYPAGHVRLHNFVTIPIFKGERIVSVVGLANKATDYEESDILQISLLMDSAWKVIDSMRSEEEKQKLAAQLLQAQKMEAIGTLAGGIAHDFNNILGAILGYAEIAGDSIPPESVAVGYLDKVMEASYRAAGLVKQILAFSRQAETEQVPLQPAVIVKEAIKILRPSLPSTITIKQQTAAVTKSIVADPTQVHQILMNLCTNAFHAMEVSGGTLEIILQDCELSTDDVRNHPGVEPGGFVMLSVGDTGTGIPFEIREKIFDPYFTTKEVGKGTGMGLAIVHGIVNKYGGFITCESTSGKGTVFRVFFPAVEAEDSTVTNPVKTIAHGREHILFVDDEHLLVELGTVMLNRLGYEVTARTNSLEALATFQSSPEQFDAVITDQTMPNMTGMDLALRILKIRPDIPIILCTGFSNLVDEEQAKKCGIKGFAMKPLTKKEVSAILRTVLDN
jgi:PAS domain S-box-containing protein